jgi:hypothetical protein
VDDTFFLAELSGVEGASEEGTSSMGDTVRLADFRRLTGAEGEDRELEDNGTVLVFAFRFEDGRGRAAR